MLRKTIVIAFILTVSLSAGAGFGRAEQFSLHSLQGGWGFNADGRLGGNPAAATGLINFDGSGHCSETATINANGVVVALTTAAGGSCSYTVNADGTGSLSVTFVGGASFVANFVIVDSKREFRFIVSDPVSANGGTVASGVAKRQD
jgi:hypothetical protein